MAQSNKVCNRVYGDGRYSIKIINNVACCVSCHQPIDLHVLSAQRPIAQIPSVWVHTKKMDMNNDK